MKYKITSTDPSAWHRPQDGFWLIPYVAFYLKVNTEHGKVRQIQIYLSKKIEIAISVRIK